jgi:Zinc carboxypeptidase/Carboxypeptidase regulatory-like domain/Dockerin type I domain
MITAAYAGDLSSAAGPRLGTLHVVEITVAERAEVDALTIAGFDVSNVRGDVVTLHATAADVARLRAAGYEVTEVERQSPYSSSAKRGSYSKALGVYHNYAAVTSMLQDYAAAHPTNCRLYTLGQSVQGRELWAMLITDNPDVEEDEPEFKYVSTMHGDEPLGTEMCLYLIGHLLDNYGTVSRVTSLIDGTAIWIVPLMSPDGLELGTRNNASGFNLNRTFPEYPTDFVGTVFDLVPLGDAGRPPEVAHVMQWTAANSFVLSANFHTGALVVNYPYDEDGVPSGTYAACPDDALFIDVSQRYSIHNTPMWNNPAFPNGITNGSDWYYVLGGMQDWNYRYAACNEFTIELSNTKRPAESSLPQFWEDNRESMLSYMEAVDMGVRGLVTDAATGAPVWARVTVHGNTQHVFTDPDVGDYHRMLLPGTYTITYSARNYLPAVAEEVVVMSGPATRVDVPLRLLDYDADINGDGDVTSSDIVLAINAAIGQTVGYDCDVNTDGEVDALDIQMVVNASLVL